MAALEDAAGSARLRGAPSHAAALLLLALDRGAAEPRLALQAALDSFAAGAAAAARELAEQVLTLDAGRSERAGALNLLGQITYLTEDFPQAVHYLEEAYREAEGEPLVRCGVAVDLAFACANLGMFPTGLDWTASAEENAALTGDAAVAAEAAGAAAVLLLLCGRGVDTARLAFALAHEDVDRPSPPLRWPSMSNALVLLWSGDLEHAGPALAAVRKRFDDRGLDSGLQLLLARLAEVAILDGDVGTAASLVAEMDEHARLEGGEAEAVLAVACRVVLAAYVGDLSGAVDGCDELQSADGIQHLLVRLTATAALGMCHLSADDPQAAADLLGPVAELVLALGVGEPVISPFFADAIDAQVAVGRAGQAEPLVRLLEAWGQRSGSRWSMGVAARGRALLLLDEGDLDAASEALDRALQDRAAPWLPALRRRRRRVGGPCATDRAAPRALVVRRVQAVRRLGEQAFEHRVPVQGPEQRLVVVRPAGVVDGVVRLAGGGREPEPGRARDLAADLRLRLRRDRVIAVRVLIDDGHVLDLLRCPCISPCCSPPPTRPVPTRAALPTRSASSSFTYMCRTPKKRERHSLCPRHSGRET